MKPPFSFAPPTDGLRGRATSGVFKTGVSQAVRLIVQIVSVVVLSRLLLPEQFGLFAMAAPILSFALLFQDLGLTQAVVQKSEITHEEVSALFWISLGLSVGLAVLLVLVAPLVGLFYKEPRVAALTAAMGLNVIFGGAGSLQYALMNRRMQFQTLAIIDIASALSALAVSIGGALIYHSIWAIYCGTLVGSAIPAVGYWAASGWRPSWPRKKSGVSHALRFGGNVTGFNLTNFFARNLDNVLIARVWGEEAVGLYDRAYKLLLLPLLQINAPISKVMLPVLAQLVGQPTRYAAAFARTLSQMFLITLPGIAFMVGTSDVMVPILLGTKWSGASPIFAVLGLASFIQTLNNPSGWLLMTQNRTREYMYWGLFSSATCILSFVIGLPFGAIGVAIAYTIGEYLRTPILWWVITRRGPITAADMMRVIAPHFSGALASLAIVIAMRRALPPSPWLVLPICLVASYITSLLVVGGFPQGRKTLGNSIELLESPYRRLFGRSAS